MEIDGVTYTPVCVMQPSGHKLMIYVPEAEAATIRQEGVIRFILCPRQDVVAEA